ncbi:telomerase reverse transcriptase-like [Pollicipes pollicipes]|uniref:telomerase reverse transcriptase-like n=1 Tax=Pollicipes pollicipes TaxID=41117 RepID=UPI0018855422|nr:telomerase reverse transcriptase-like [Pollicipes pollicipes]
MDHSKQHKTRRSKRKRPPRQETASRVTTATPFIEIPFSHILHSRQSRHHFPPSHPLHAGGQANCARIKLLLRQVLETSVDVRADLLGPRRLDAAIGHLLSLGRHDVLCVGDVTRGLRRWSAFAASRRRMPSPLWFVRVDVRDAYGSVQHQLLLRVVRERLAELPATVVLCRRPRGGYALWGASAAGPRTPVRTADVAAALDRLVTGQVVLYGRRAFLFTCGIPQGGPLSSALCDLYYGAMLRRAANWCFPPEPQAALLLLRSVDDILLLTERRRAALCFHQMAQAGVEQFSCRMNPDKMRTNLFTDPGPEVAFVGSVFHTGTLEVSPDTAAYDGVDMRFTFRTVRLRRPGEYLRARLIYLATVRMTPLHWDPRVNSSERLWRSLRAHFVVTARRYGGYAAWAGAPAVRRAAVAAFLRVLPPELEVLRAALRRVGRCRKRAGPTAEMRLTVRTDRLGEGSAAPEGETQ